MKPPLTLVRLMTCLGSIFGPAIDNIPLRYTMLAFAEYHLPDASSERCRRYFETALSALKRKSREQWTEKDAFAAIFLPGNLWHSIRTNTGGVHGHQCTLCTQRSPSLSRSIVQHLVARGWGYEVLATFLPTLWLGPRASRECNEMAVINSRVPFLGAIVDESGVSTELDAISSCCKELFRKSMYEDIWSEIAQTFSVWRALSDLFQLFHDFVKWEITNGNNRLCSHEMLVAWLTRVETSMLPICREICLRENNICFSRAHINHGVCFSLSNIFLVTVMKASDIVSGLMSVEGAAASRQLLRWLSLSLEAFGSDLLDLWVGDPDVMLPLILAALTAGPILAVDSLYRQNGNLFLKRRMTVSRNYNTTS